MQKLVLVLWPSFWVAVVAEALFFTVIDPAEFYLFGAQVDFSPIATYSIGFVGFWAICAASSFATLFYMRTPQEINHLPPRPHHSAHLH
ncbi:hypothetical protein [Niveibacterium microcysteis]|uniref:Transmembrane protein n=1 Tax=Niveibacterium microcysteis TaxID=2811415 RepID=A0ABX7MAF0_9RHOO|nr:hypothetical protein [Niveibacterium microcysteis]QSI78726.1 hypothetical protein JY500_09025 [Niveibacterium microcysteis]